jgi:hypothetical protein
MIAPPVVLAASVVPAAAVTAMGLELAGLIMTAAIVTVEAGDAESVTVTACGAAARTPAEEVCKLQLTVIPEVVTSVAPDLTTIPAANIVLEKKTIASRGRITLDLSIRRCFIESFSLLTRRRSCRGVTDSICHCTSYRPLRPGTLVQISP